MYHAAHSTFIIWASEFVKTLGVTGGIGGGKTTVCRMLEARGARVFYADDVAKQLMQDDPALRAEIAAAFGPQSYDADGRLDRAYLAEQVFSSEENTRRINALVHPRVFAAFEEAKAAAQQEGVALLVHEAALLFEAGGDAHVDAVAVVDAPETERIRRVTARDDTAEAQVRARMARQLPPEELRRRADYVIENDGSLERLRRQVERLHRMLIAGA